MKVLHLTTHLNPGGITSYIEKLLKPMLKLGVKCEVVSSGGEMVAHFEELGVRCHQLDIRTKSELSPKLWRAAPQLAALIEKKDYDLMHAHTRVTQVLAHRVSKKSKIPVVTTCHGFFKKRLGRSFLPAWGDCVVAISEPVRETLLKQYSKENLQVVTILNAVDCDALRNDLSEVQAQEVKTKEFGFKEDDIVIGNIGRLVPMKGHDLLVEAFKLIQNKIPTAKLLLVGEGRFKSELEKLVGKLGVSKSVCFAGALKNPVKALAIMDVFVFPVSGGEGFGLSPLEAMAAGVPVVTGAGWPLICNFSAESEAIVMDTLEPQMIADTVSNLINDKDLREMLGARGADFAREGFHIDRMALEMKAVYERIRLTRSHASL